MIVSSCFGPCLTLCVSAGEVHEGEYRSGKKHGPGFLRYANGDVYAGVWSGDTLTGKGEFTWADGEVQGGRWEKSP